MVRVMCGVQLKDRKRAKDLMLILGLNETDQISMENNVCWCGHVSGKEYGHILRKALVFEVNGLR